MTVTATKDGLYVTSSKLVTVKYRVYFSNLLHRWCCDCPQWVHRCYQENKDCKHITEVLTFIDNASMEELRKRVKKQ